MLDHIVDKYNQKFHRTIKVKPMGVKSYAEYNVCSNVKHPKFKVGDHVRISKYKNIFANGYTPNCSEELVFISKTKNIIPWAYVIRLLRLIKKNLE